MSQQTHHFYDFDQHPLLHTTDIVFYNWNGLVFSYILMNCTKFCILLLLEILIILKK